MARCREGAALYLTTVGTHPKSKTAAVMEHMRTRRVIAQISSALYQSHVHHAGTKACTPSNRGDTSQHSIRVQPPRQRCESKTAHSRHTIVQVVHSWCVMPSVCMCRFHEWMVSSYTWCVLLQAAMLVQAFVLVLRFWVFLTIHVTFGFVPLPLNRVVLTVGLAVRIIFLLV